MSIKWKIKEVNVSELKGYEDNPRNIEEKPLKALKGSLEEFGQVTPLVVDTEMNVLGGNQRMKLIKGKVKVSYPNRKLTEKEKKEIVIALNGSIGDWDYDRLLNLGWESKELIENFGFDAGVIYSFEPDFDEFDFDGMDTAKVIKKIIFNFRNDKEGLGLIEKAKEKFDTTYVEDILIQLLKYEENSN